MKKYFVIAIALILCLSTFVFTACEVEEEPFVYANFGEFSCNGRVLTDYAVREITASEAKQILRSIYQTNYATSVPNSRRCSVNSTIASASNGNISEDCVNSILRYCACMKITTKYYVAGETEAKTKVDEVTGADLRYILQNNYFSPFNQLVAKNVVLNEELIDFMEEENAEFQRSEISLVAPFKCIFTYHKDIHGNLIVQTRDYAEIASSVGGGIGCSYRQDTEIIYDATGKMVKWQTSLGLSSSTPQGTMKDGYILEIDVDWIEKD